MRILAAEAAQENIDLVAVAASLGVLKKEEIGSGAEKDAATTHLNAAGHVEMRQILALGPDGDLVGLAGAGRVLQHLDAVACLSARRRALGVFIALHHPQPAFLIHGERDRVDDVRLGGEDLDFPTGRHAHATNGFFGAQIRLAGRPRVDEAVFALGVEQRTGYPQDRKTGDEPADCEHRQLLGVERQRAAACLFTLSLSSPFATFDGV